MGLLNEQFVKFKANDKIYTLQLTDNSNMDCSVVVNGTRYYIASKEETIKNLEANQVYTDNVEIFYKANDKLISLGVQENIYTPKIISATWDYIYTEREDFEYSGVHFFDECATVNPEERIPKTKEMLCNNTVDWIINNAEQVFDGEHRFVVAAINTAPLSITFQCGVADNFTMSNVSIPLHGEQRFMVYAQETEIIH